jgi:Zn-dependent metalloprotease
MTTIARPVSVSTPSGASLVVPIDGTRGNLKPMSQAQLDASSDATLKQTVANATTVMTFFKTAFGRDGLDGHGKTLPVVVHSPDPQFGGKMNNAYWDGETNKMYIGDGDGRMFKPLGLSTDIIAHECGHAILESEIEMGFDGQEGALHESFGDVMGSLVDADDWQIGEDSYTPNTPGDALRDLSKPQRFSNMSQVRGETEPHLLADIPNLAAVRVAEKIGRTEMGKVWYDGYTSEMKDHAQFNDAALATVKAAEKLYGAGSKEVSAVTDAWKSVGLLTKAA